MRKRLIKIKTLCCLIVAFLLSGCDDVSDTYTTKYQVLFYYTAVSATELYTAVNSPGQYVAVRQSGSYILMQGFSSSTRYSVDAISFQSFYFGLGGLIIGTSYNTNSHGSYELLAYDLACPNCDIASRRLSLSDDGLATCSKCGTVYDMNNYGMITSYDESNGFESPRGLYRYRISYDGTTVRVYN